ncbi:dTDP-4-dehydrorhamnose 3,5-epimerase [bioreactor metagenome]|uniref:dTDP-4-dehydrorhamnose 3,5-epimerase n=1 Tax=bioreactor metagenome TaxID=1076179 RepID=A0A645A1T6_9ZZZZ
MEHIKTKLQNAVIIQPKVIGDNRGWFMESYSKCKFMQLGLNIDFVQDNRSFSQHKGTLRGLHCQKAPMAQAKLVSCVRGSMMDVIVDIRKGSPSYLQWIAVELSEINKKMLFVPKGFLHGFVTLTDNVEINYKVDECYSPENDRSIRFDDAVFGVDWNVFDPILSEKDKKAPLYKDSDVEYIYSETV